MSARLSLRQLAILQSVATVPTTLVFLPGLTLQKVGHDAVWTVFGASLLGLAWTILIAWAGQGKSPQAVLADITPRCLGRGLLLLYGITLASVIIAQWDELSAFVQAELLPATPSWAVLALALCAVMVCTRKGWLGLSRTVDIIAPLAAVAFVMMAAWTASLVQGWNLLPWLLLHPVHDLKAVWLPATFIGEGFVGMAYADFTKGTPRQITTAVVAGQVVSSGVLVVVVLLALGGLGPVYGGMVTYPWYALIKELRLDGFLTHLEFLFGPMWIMLLYLKSAIWLIAVADVGRKIWHKSPYWGWILATGLVTMAFSVSHSTDTSRLVYLRVWWGNREFPLLWILAVGGGISARWRHQKDSQHGPVPVESSSSGPA